jgi:hypothetical protein
MNLLITSQNELNPVAPPALPQATMEYDRRYQDQFNNVLRLYFNRINALQQQFSTAATVIPPTTVYTVATLPSASASGVGARSFVSDASGPVFEAIVVGSGAVIVPVYSDGTNWKVG